VPNQGATTVAPATGGHSDVSTWVVGLLVVAVTAVGAAVRFTGIGDKSLWIDEAFSLWVSRQPVEDMLRTTVDLDFHPPLYYLSLHPWLAFGDGEAAARSLSAVFSILTLPVVFVIGNRIGGRALGLLSSGLLALSPLQTQYAQQARMYAMMTFFAAVSIACLLHVLSSEPRSPGVDSHAAFVTRSRVYWVGFVVSTTLTMLSHNTGVLLPVSIALFIAIVTLRRRHSSGAGGHSGIGARRRLTDGIVGTATGLVAAVALWLPWMPHFLSQSLRVDDEFWIAPPTLSTFLDHWGDLANAFGPAGFLRIVVLLAVAALVLLGSRQVWGSSPAQLILLLSLLFTPVAVELLISLRRPIFFTQTLVWTSIPLIVLLAAGLLRIRSRALAASALSLIVLLSAVALVNYHQNDGKENWRAAVEYIADRVQSHELLLFSAAWAQIPFDYYYERHSAPDVVRHGLPTDLVDSEVLEQKMTAADVVRLDQLTLGRPTFWVVYSHDWYTDAGGIVPSRLSASFRAVDTQTFTGIVVVHYRSESR
jgi:mannosyltransferase